MPVSRWLLRRVVPVVAPLTAVFALVLFLAFPSVARAAVPAGSVIVATVPTNGSCSSGDVIELQSGDKLSVQGDNLVFTRDVDTDIPTHTSLSFTFEVVPNAACRMFVPTTLTINGEAFEHTDQVSGTGTTLSINLYAPGTVPPPPTSTPTPTETPTKPTETPTEPTETPTEPTETPTEPTETPTEPTETPTEPTETPTEPTETPTEPTETPTVAPTGTTSPTTPGHPAPPTCPGCGQVDPVPEGGAATGGGGTGGIEGKGLLGLGLAGLGIGSAGLLITRRRSRAPHE